MKGLLWLFALLPIVAWAQDIETDLWARASAPGAKAGAAYGRIVNHGNSVVTLSRMSSKTAKMVEVHETVMVGDMMRMRPVDPVEIGPGETLALVPGGAHVMLMGLSSPLVQGTEFTLQLVFDDGQTVEAKVVVGQIGQMERPE